MRVGNVILVKTTEEIRVGNYTGPSVVVIPQNTLLEVLVKHWETDKEKILCVIRVSFDKINFFLPKEKLAEVH